MRVIDPVSDYARKVGRGKLPACRLVKAACRRHLADLKRSKAKRYPYFFDLAAVRKVLKFCGLVSHYKGPAKGEAFEPEPWQVFILGCIFGWKRRQDGLRRFRYAYVEVPRKNGKTFLAAAVALFMLSADGEGGPEVYSSATKRDQAKLVWSDAVKMARKSPTLRKHFVPRYASLEFPLTDGIFQPLAADSEKLDGLNPHCVVNDELHAWPDRYLWDVLEDAFGARAQPLMFSITTAGFNREGICFEQRTHCESILMVDGYDDDTTFAYIATVDKRLEKKWDTPAAWRQANPGLGTVKSEEYLRDQVEKAKVMPAKEFSLKTKQLNIWTKGEEKWIDPNRWDENSGESIDEAELEGRECFTGLDLASTTDVAAAVHLFPPDGDKVTALVCRFWIPEEGMRARVKRDRVPFDAWSAAGWVRPTDGEIIDYDHLFADMVADSERFRIREVGFDPWNATDLATRMASEGFDMVQMRQGMATLAGPTREFEKRVRAREFRHGGNPVLRWMVSNAVVQRDSNDNIRPDKKKSAERIDGVVAAVMGLGRMIQAEAARATVYEERGIRTF